MTYGQPISDAAGRALLDVIAFARDNKESRIYEDLPAGSDPAKLLPLIKPMTLDRMAHAGGALRHYPEREVRYRPSTFYAGDDPLVLVPQRVDDRWLLVEESIAHKDPTVAVLLSALTTQLGPLFYYTARAARVPAAMLSPRNIPVARQVIAETGARFVAAEPQVAYALHEALIEQGESIRDMRWHLIVPVGAMSRPHALTGSVMYDVHVFPGTSIGRARIGDGTVRFEPSPAYYFEITDTACLVTSLTREAFPLIRFALPRFIEVDEATRADGTFAMLL